MKKVKMLVEKLSNFPEGVELEYKTAGACAFDLVAAINEPITFRTTDRNWQTNMENGVTFKLIPTGIKVVVPEGYALQILPRSSSNKKGLMIPNSPGLIDQDYRGEIFVGLFKAYGDSVVVNPGDGIAQALLVKIGIADINYGVVNNDTARGDGGFGSTDKK